MRKIMMVLVAVVMASMLSGCGTYNTIIAKDEGVKSAWSQVINVYQRRADLIPNLVNTVKGYAAHEQAVFTQVTEARAKVGSINVNADDPASLKAYQDAQAGLQSAIGRLMMVAENYPNLKADQGFLQLQAQLEGTANRITVERQRYIQTVQDYNTYIRSFPQNVIAMVFGYKAKPNFTVDNERAIQTAPQVDFGNSNPPATTQPAPQQQPAPAPAQ